MQEIGLLKLYSNRTFTAGFKVDPELWSRFKGECKIRGVSICHVLEALMEAWIEGQKATATVIKPVTVNLTMQHVVKRPRRSLDLRDVSWQAQKAIWPPNCEHADHYVKSTREVGCTRIRDFVDLAKCWRCYIIEEGA